MGEEIYKIEDFSEPITSVEGRQTGVFWDIEDYPFPDSYEPDLIYKKVFSALDVRGCSVGDMTIWAYVDEKKGSWDKFLLQKTWKAKIYFIPGGDKLGRRTRMLHDIILWVMDMDSPVHNPNLIVISDKVKEDEEFFTRLDILRARYYGVFLIQPTGDGSPDSDKWPGLLFDQPYSFFLEHSQGSLKKKKNGCT